MTHKEIYEQLLDEFEMTVGRPATPQERINLLQESIIQYATFFMQKGRKC